MSPADDASLEPAGGGAAREPAPGPLPAPPAPPRAEHIPPVPDNPMAEYFRRRLDVLQRELSSERERSREAEAVLKNQEALRAEVDRQLKEILAQLKSEKRAAQDEDEKSRARGRIDALEKRLDEMHQTWAGMLREALGRPSASGGGAEVEAAVRAVAEGLAALKVDVQAVRDTVGSVPQLLPEVRGIRGEIPASVERVEEDERRLASQLRDMVSAFGARLDERMAELDRRVAHELAGHQDRLAGLARERGALQEALEEARHQVRQEALKDRMALQAQFNEQLLAVRTAMEKLREGMEGSSGASRSLLELAERIHSVVTQPEAAKDEIIVELEQEKRDLIKALKDRTDQLRHYTLERREVERSMGEALMGLTRELEAGRAELQRVSSGIAGLEAERDSLKGSLELSRRKEAEAAERFRALAAERDELVKALMAEAAKVQDQISVRIESDKAWESRLKELQGLLEAERDCRLAAERQGSELRAQLRTVSEHIASVLRDKELAESRTEAWKTERESLVAALRKKDEMISMLSATFQNIVKKP